MDKWIDVCEVNALNPGERRFIDLGDKRIMVVSVEGEFYAIESMCTHAMFELDDAPISDCTITCPLHGAHFCLKTGEPLSAPATEAILCYPLRIHEEMIQIQDV